MSAMSRPHIYPPANLDLPYTLHTDRHKLEDADVPVITISATYKRQIAEERGEVAKVFDEIVFSRAHYSMARSIVEEAKTKKLSSWLVDPTNFVSQAEWKMLARTEKIGEIIARFPLLKKIKDLTDPLIRSNLPIADAVREPLTYVTFRTKKPIISMHYESGNILATLGKQVLQVVTDPHVRPNYLQECERKNIHFAVFDEETKKMFLNLAKDLKKSFDPHRITVTGPPIDPRIVKLRKLKKAPYSTPRPLRVCITTSGLGTNKGEIKEALESLAPGIKSKQIEVLLYASTHPDFKKLFEEILEKEDIKQRAKIIYHRSIVDANEDLVKTAFPWADCFITKPSGDMAYDAIAAGCFFLYLEPWGVWEEQIEKIFSNMGVCQRAEVSRMLTQIEHLTESGWIAKAAVRARNIDPLFLNGAKKIVDLQQNLKLQ